jgi:hypothetical protein
MQTSSDELHTSILIKAFLYLNKSVWYLHTVFLASNLALCRSFPESKAFYIQLYYCGSVLYLSGKRNSSCMQNIVIFVLCVLLKLLSLCCDLNWIQIYCIQVKSMDMHYSTHFRVPSVVYWDSMLWNLYRRIVRILYIFWTNNVRSNFLSVSRSFPFNKSGYFHLKILHDT